MEYSIEDSSNETLEREIQELEDAYAECLADEVDQETLLLIWLRIKALKRELASRQNLA